MNSKHAPLRTVNANVCESVSICYLAKRQKNLKWNRQVTCFKFTSYLNVAPCLFLPSKGAQNPLLLVTYLTRCFVNRPISFYSEFA